MEGIFPLGGKTRRSRIWSALTFLSGAFLIGLCGFLKAVDPQAGSELAVLCLLGTCFCLWAVLSMLYNRNGYVRLENGRIQARYHWLGRLDCNLTDIEFVLPQINTLTILLKNGKRHVITGIEDPWLLSSILRRQRFEVEQETPETLRWELARTKAQRKKELYWVIFGTVMLFVNILLTVLLTGGREFSAFCGSDWYLFAGMGATELLTFGALLFAANRCGKRRLSLEWLAYRLRGAVIGTYPLPRNLVRRVYTDENHSGRVVVCGFPNAESVYYCVQEFGADEKLETVYSSQIYASQKELPEDEFSRLMDITALFSQM